MLIPSFNADVYFFTKEKQRQGGRCNLNKQAKLINEQLQ